MHNKHDIQPNESTGTTLIKMLEKKEGCEFVYMTGSYNQALKKVYLYKRFRTKNTSYANDSRSVPIVNNSGDIIAPPTKGSTRRRSKQKTQYKMNVPWANNKKKKTSLDDDIIWVHDDISPEEGSDPERFVKTVVEALRLGDDKILLAVAWSAKEGRLNHKKYPEVLGVDVTYGKNNKKKASISCYWKRHQKQKHPHS